MEKVELAKETDEKVHYMNQGDISMYSKENIAKRQKIRSDPLMVKTLGKFGVVSCGCLFASAMYSFEGEVIVFQIRNAMCW